MLTFIKMICYNIVIYIVTYYNIVIYIVIYYNTVIYYFIVLMHTTEVNYC